VHFNCIFYSKFDFNIVTTFLCSMSSAARMSGTHGRGVVSGASAAGCHGAGHRAVDGAEASQRLERGDAPVKVLLIDHSYVRRLDEYMQQNPEARNLGIHPTVATVSCVGQGGAFLRPVDPRKEGDLQRSFLHMMSTSLHGRPYIIFIHIGENDYGYRSVHTICMSPRFYSDQQVVSVPDIPTMSC